MCTLYIHIRLLLCYRFFHTYPPKHGSEMRKAQLLPLRLL